MNTSFRRNENRSHLHEGLLLPAAHFSHVPLRKQAIVSVEARRETLEIPEVVPLSSYLSYLVEAPNKQVYSAARKTSFI